MSCKERPKFNIRIDLIREEIENAIIEEEIKRVKNPIINTNGKNFPILKENNHYFLFGLKKPLNEDDIKEGLPK